jgi:hypothetical protein
MPRAGTSQVQTSTGSGLYSFTPPVNRASADVTEHLGRYRYLVDRTLAWHNCVWRLTMRCEPREDIHLASATLRCALICFNQCKRL